MGMRRIKQLAFFVTLFWSGIHAFGQVDDGQLGAWYMYFFDAKFKESKWGVQGDVQYRNWDVLGDLEQLLIRSGVTYRPENTNLKLTLGYANITTGSFGEDNSTVSENRLYQEAFFPKNFGTHVLTNHRFRYEQRFVEGQDFRTRYRYNLFVNIPLQKEGIVPKSFYLAFYNELFINGERSIGDGREVELFDRNRSYAALGYQVSDALKLQFGIMRQITTNWSKNQLQLSFHHSF